MIRADFQVAEEEREGDLRREGGREVKRRQKARAEGFNTSWARYFPINRVAELTQSAWPPEPISKLLDSPTFRLDFANRERKMPS